METSTTDPTTSEPALANLELIAENNNGNMTENDFHFACLTVESSTDAPLPFGYSHFLTTVRRNDFEGTLVNIDESNVRSNDFEEAKNLVFYEKIPSLQTMTSSKVAIVLWLRVISLKRSKRKATWYPAFEFARTEDQNEVCKLIESLPVPRLIREQIVNCLDLVRSELNEWVHYFTQHIFMTKNSSPEDPVKMSDLMFCHWLPNSTIDHRKTALNMLSNSRLSFTDKFKIMCKYCLEDEINKLSPESIPERFVRKISFNKNPIIYYWLCYLNGELHKLPRMDGQSVECFLITGFNVDTWSAIEYFWDRLSFNEQVSKSLVLLNRKPQFQRQLFTKMDEFQRSHVLSKKPFEITMNFWRQKSQEWFAYLTWIRIKDTIKYHQFTEFIYAFLIESLPDRVEKLRYLSKIWSSSSDDFINRALKSMKNTMIGLHSKFYDSPCNPEFLLNFLSYGSVEFRKAVMFEQGSSLVLYNDFSTIDKLIELCLPDPKDVIEFKNILLKSESVRRHCCSMFDGHHGGVDRLISFRDHYCPDSISRTEFLCEILDRWTIEGTVIYTLARWNEVIESIDRHILDTFPDQAIKFKKQVAWSFARHSVHCWFQGDELNKVIDVIDGLFDTDDLNKFKASVVEELSTQFQWSEFDEKYVQSILSWGFNNDGRKIKEFKESIPIDDVFESRLNAMKWIIASSQDVSMILAPIDKMLLWCFESVDKVKKYKLEKVFGYSDGGYRLFIRNNNRFDEEYARIILPWFFNGDEEQIRKFKEKYKGDLISNLIDVD
ncbi:hypothetical protein U1Q18_044680 [Sarracenia purpurea var. burkii]